MVKDRLAIDDGTIQKLWIEGAIRTLQKKIESLKTMDDEIINLIGGTDTEGMEAWLEKDVDDCDEVQAECPHCRTDGGKTKQEARILGRI